MGELTPGAREWLVGRHRAVLITVRADGTPQSSNVLAAFDGQVFRISVTSDRAKTRNLVRDPRAVMHVLGSDFWSFASVTCTAMVGPVSVQAGDEAGRDLLAVYDAISDSPHPDPRQFYEVMVDEHRLVLSLDADAVTGMGWDG